MFVKLRVKITDAIKQTYLIAPSGGSCRPGTLEAAGEGVVSLSITTGRRITGSVCLADGVPATNQRHRGAVVKAHATKGPSDIRSTGHWIVRSSDWTSWIHVNEL